MRKRLLSIFLSLVMIVSLLPVSALATDEGSPDSGTDVVCMELDGCIDGVHDADCPLAEPPAGPTEDLPEESAPAPEVTPDATGDPEEVPAPDVIPEEVQAFLDAVEALDLENPDPAAVAEARDAYDALTEEQQAREDVSTGYVTLLAVQEQLDNAVNAVPAAEDGVIYVSEAGDDDNPGTSEAPVATLAKAVDMAEDGDTIYVLSNLDVKANARITDKHLTITSADDGPYTLTRVEDFSTASDNHQSHYNPAMIEVTTNGGDDSENAASVTLTNIILDDGGKHEGIYFAQTNVPIEEKVNNLDHVQDSIVTAHGLENRAVHIILSDGAVLKDFGGMSAVYGTTNAHITMENGSLICDESVTDRNASDTKKAPGETGPAGAVWLQGAEFVMEDGAEISNVVGRAVYVDSGETSIDGTIKYITSDADMWWGTSGLALHLRNKADAKVSGTVSDLIGNDCAIEVLDSTLHMTQTSVLKNSKYGINISSSELVQLDGEITGCVGGGHVLTMQNNGSPMNCTIGKTGNIHHNGCSYGVIYIQAPHGNLEIYGKINYNTTNDRAGAIALAHNFQGHTVTMYDGAEMIGNSSTETGGAVMVSGGTFIMEGGTISENSAGLEGGGVFVRNGGTFIMKGGIISNNTTQTLGGGLAFQAKDWGVFIPNVNLLGGEISNNIDKNGANDIAVMSSGDSYIARSIFISENQHISVPAISFATNHKTITLDADSLNTRLGNANAASISALTDASAAKGWGSPAATFWMQRNGAASMTIDGLTLTSGLPVYVLTQKSGADGKPDDSSPVNVYSAKLTNGAVEITLPVVDMHGNGCAVAIVQPTADYGSVVIESSETLNEVPGVASYDVPYTATYTMSENLKNMIEQGQSGITDDNCSFTFVVQLDHRLTAKTDVQDYTFTSPIFVVDHISNEGSTLTVTCKLKDDWTAHIEELTATPMTLTGTGVLNAEDFEDGDLLTTTGNIQVKALNTSITIPANICQTMMVAQKTFTVSFNSDGGTAISPQTVIAGKTATEPEAPTRDGYDFAGWYLGEVKYDFDTPVTEDITLVAHWTEKAIITIRPVDLTKYVTGDHDHEGESYINCFPDPRYEGIPENATITVAGIPWEKDHPSGSQYPFTITYYEKDEDGLTPIIDDHQPGTYIARVEILPGLGARPGDIQINGQKIAFKDGELAIRAVSNASDVEDIEEISSAVTSAKPTQKVEQALAVMPEGMTYLVNNIAGQELNAGHDIRLLHDELLSAPGGDVYADAMIARLEKEGVTSEGGRQYAMKYLDLIDANDSNLLVCAQKPYQIYIPYPAGTDQNTEFALFYFGGLNRTYTEQDYGQNVFENIKNSKVIAFKIEKAEAGIVFTVVPPPENQSDNYSIGAMALTWTQAQHTVTFDSNGGSSVPAQTVTAGDKATEPKDPTRRGYDFDGWYLEGKKYDFDTPVTADITLVALWSRRGGGSGTIHYVLSYDSNGGTRYKDETYRKNTVVKLDKLPVREGYTFTGWYADKARTRPIDEIKMTSDKTVYAGWTRSYIPGDLNHRDHTAYVSGYPDGTVRPNASVTRAETATMLYRLLTDARREEIETAVIPFHDVTPTIWYAQAVAAMANGGYITGYEDGTFGGNKPITRAEFVAMLVRFIGLEEAQCSFTDVSRIHWAYEHIATATAAEWIGGYPDGTFGPSRSITRAEAMTIINRVLDRGVNEESTLPDFKVWPDNPETAWFYYEVIEATNDHEYTGSRPSEDWTRVR